MATELRKGRTKRKTATYTVRVRRVDGQRQLFINGERTMGAAEVGDALGVRVQNLQFIKDLPEPVDGIRASRLWLGHEVKAFAKVYRARRPHPAEKAA